MNADTAKLSILVTPATKRRLEAEAQAKKTSVGDLVRRRLSGELDGEEQLFMDALAALGRRANAVTAELDATRAELEREGATWAERDAEIRRATLAELTDRDRAAAAALFTAAPASPRRSAQP